MIKLFSLEDYRKILKQSLLDRKESLSNHFTFQNMAKACRVQKTYLSTVLNGSGHLSSDQVFDCSVFLGLSPNECEFIQVLYDYQRSVSKPRKALLLSKCQDLILKSQSTESHIQTDDVHVSTLELNDYYLNPMSQLVHMFLTIDSNREDVQKISNALAINQKELTEILNSLSTMGFISFVDRKIRVLKDHVHLSQQSKIYNAHRKLMRMKSLERLDQSQSPDPYCFSVVFSADEETFFDIKNDFLIMLKKAQKRVKLSSEKRVFQMNFDLFSWDG